MRTGKVGAKKVFWYKHPLIFGIILTIFIPVLIIYISKISWLIGVNFLNSDWLGFWGSYFGASVSVLVAIWVVKYETEETNEAQSEVIRYQLETTKLIKKMISEQSKLHYSNEIIKMKRHLEDYNGFIEFVEQFANEASRASKAQNKSVHPLLLKIVINLFVKELEFIEDFANICPVESYEYAEEYADKLTTLNSSIIGIRDYLDAISNRAYQEDDESGLKYFGREILNDIPELTKAFNDLYHSVVAMDIEEN